MGAGSSGSPPAATRWGRRARGRSPRSSPGVRSTNCTCPQPGWEIREHAVPAEALEGAPYGSGGISWRAMPADFPPWNHRVYAFFRRRSEHGPVTEFHVRPRGKARERVGREAEPTTGIIDAVGAGCRDGAGCLTRPRRREESTGPQTAHRDRLPRPAACRRGHRREHRRPGAAAGLLTRLRRLHHDVTLIWADGGYTGGLVEWCRRKLTLTLQIVKRTDDMAGFVVLPRRVVAERTSAWRLCRRSLIPSASRSAVGRRTGTSVSSGARGACSGRCRPVDRMPRHDHGLGNGQASSAAMRSRTASLPSARAGTRRPWPPPSRVRTCRCPSWRARTRSVLLPAISAEPSAV